MEGAEEEGGEGKGKRGERTVVQLFKHTFQQCSHMHANSTDFYLCSQLVSQARPKTPSVYFAFSITHEKG